MGGRVRVHRGDPPGVDGGLVLADLVEEGALPVEVVQLVCAGLGEQEVLDTQPYQGFHGRAAGGAAAGDEDGELRQPVLRLVGDEAAVAGGEVGVERLVEWRGWW